MTFWYLGSYQNVKDAVELTPLNSVFLLIIICSFAYQSRWFISSLSSK